MSQLRESRKREGQTLVALARRAGVSERTLRRAEDGGSISEVTRSKIVKAFNKIPDRLRDYTAEELFGADS